MPNSVKLFEQLLNVTNTLKSKNLIILVETTNAIEKAKAFVRACIAKDIPIREAILFGSYAKGEERQYSDIDLALVSDAFTLNFIENNHKTALINYRFSDIEVHHFNTKYFERELPFLNEIKRTGIKIYQL